MNLSFKCSSHKGETCLLETGNVCQVAANFRARQLPGIVRREFVAWPSRGWALHRLIVSECGLCNSDY